MVKKKQMIALGGFFLIPFCSVISHTILPIPPTLILWGISFFLFLFIISLNGGNIPRINSVSFIPLLFSGYLFFSQLLIGVDLRPLVSPFAAPLYFALTVFYLDQLDNNVSKKLITNFIYLSVFLFLIEAYWRITHPVMPDFDPSDSDSYKWFYIYKGPGLMYIETNGLAIHIIVVLFFTLWWGEFLKKNFLIIKVLLLLVLFLSFSRAAILSLLTGVIYFFYARKIKASTFYLCTVFAIIPLILYFMTDALIFLNNDASTRSKFDLVDDVVKFYANSDLLSILFGIGNYNSKKVFSLYAHNYFLVYAIEMGIVGLFFVLTQFKHFVSTSKKEILVVLIPFVVQVMSSTVIFIPYFYMISAVIYYFSNHEKNSRNNS